MALRLLALQLVLCGSAAEQCEPAMGGLCGVVLSSCTTSSQRWTVPAAGAASPHAQVALTAPASMADKVLDIGGWDNQTGAFMHVWTRSTNGWTVINQQWRAEPAADASGPFRLVSLMNGLCLSCGAAAAGEHVLTVNCTSSGAEAGLLQLWTLASGQLRLADSGMGSRSDSSGGRSQQRWDELHVARAPALCMSVEEQQNCSSSTLASMPFCDAALPAAQRAADLATRLSLDEMLSIMSPAGGAVPRLGVPTMGHQECQHGVWEGGNTCGTGTEAACPTSFPNLLSLGASFNRSLASAIATAIAQEVRALHNDGQRAGLTCWAPNTNLFRDPRWGRGQEVFSEDALHTSQLVEPYVRALQGGGPWRTATATCKHTYTYDMEGSWPQGSQSINRGNFDAIVSSRDLEAYYLRPFEACLREGRAGSLMCSYGAVNGVPTCADREMNLVFRSWSNESFLMSDCDAVQNILAPHNFTHTNASTCAAGLNGLCDYDCGSFYVDHMTEALAEKLVTMKRLQESTARILTAAFLHGEFEPDAKVALRKIGPEVVNSPAHSTLALDVAEQAIVLLKSEPVAGGSKPLLPLDASTLRRVAFIGPHANSSELLLGNYFGRNTQVNSHTPLLSARAVLTSLGSKATVTVHPGVPCQPVTNANTGNEYELCEFAGSNTSLISAAAEAAAAAEIAVVFLGSTACNNTLTQSCIEGEGRDRHGIGLPATQLALLQAVVQKQPSTILVLVNGGAISAAWAKQHVPAVVEALYPGERGGEAIANVLFGRVSPAGRLPFTVPQEDFIQRNMLNMDLRAEGGVTYQWLQAEPVWEFGAGVSYSTFEWVWHAPPAEEQITTLQIAAVADAGGVDLPAAIVKNTGGYKSDAVSLGFVSAAANRTADYPIRALFDFDRASLAIGGSATVRLRLSSQSLSVVEEGGARWLRPAEFEVQVGEDNSLAPSKGGGARMRLRLYGEAVRLPSYNWPVQST